MARLRPLRTQKLLDRAERSKHDKRTFAAPPATRPIRGTQGPAATNAQGTNELDRMEEHRALVFEYDVLLTSGGARQLFEVDSLVAA